MKEDKNPVKLKCERLNLDWAKVKESLEASLIGGFAIISKENNKFMVKFTSKSLNKKNEKYQNDINEMIGDGDSLLEAQMIAGIVKEYGDSPSAGV